MKDGERNGEGVFYYKDGGYYEGQWKDNKMNGFGKLYYESGKLAYEGHWFRD
jgi:antitoxin component YwqK of YwqJK toxin-antitoxin module